MLTKYPKPKKSALKPAKNNAILMEKTLLRSDVIFIADILADTILSTQMHKKIIVTAIMPIAGPPFRYQILPNAHAFKQQFKAD